MSLLFIALCAIHDSGHPNARLLATPQSLAALGSKVRIVDLRDKKQFDAGHIPNAMWIDAVEWGKTFGDHPTDENWPRRIGQLGIGGKTIVVVYGDDDVRNAARIWWILRYSGVDDVRLLDGGYGRWVNSGAPVERTQFTATTENVAPLEPSRRRLESKDDLLKTIDSKSAQIVDARSKNEYCGVADTAKRNGKVPGAIHLEWTEVIDPKTKCFKSADVLAKLIKDRNIDLNKPIVTYCQSGGRASVVAFALELMGGQQVRNYYRSWSEWGNDPNTPIEKEK